MNPRVAIITPASGRHELRQCLESVAAQTYKDITHIVVIDGHKRAGAVHATLNSCDSKIRKQLHVVELPEPTGFDGYNGHRIYGGVSFLHNADWIAYLDEDNWYDPSHIKSLVDLVSANRLQWAYALRKIVSWEGRYLCRDNCNSLGWWPSYDGCYCHVDTNCYFIRSDIAIELGWIWNRRSGIADIETADRTLCSHLLRQFPQTFTTGRYTVNYRIGSRGDEAMTLQYYRYGNQIMRAIFRRFPWAAMTISGQLKEHPCLAWELASRSPALDLVYRVIQKHLSPVAPSVRRCD